jgi:homoserine O-acetyltransferase/O-succinyltransferase
MKVYQHKGNFVLESGQSLKDIEIAYHTIGKPNANASNVVWVCHALTGNSNPTEWWPGLFGSNTFYDPEDYFIVCANVLGSCYGSTNPLSINPNTNQPYYHLFPEITIRDIVKSLQLLAKHLNINKVHTLIGGSLGGQQALEWAISEPKRFDHLVLIATNAYHSPWGIAFNESQRLAIYADRTYYSTHPDGGSKGLLTARSIALLSYRSYDAYNASQQEEDQNKTKQYKAASYQKYQGEKLIQRFNAFSYVILSKAMDSHHIGRNRKSIIQTLQSIEAKTLCIAIDSDILFPKQEQCFINSHIKDSQYMEVKSIYGHDGFLIETKAITKCLKHFYYGIQQKSTCMEFD